MVDDDEEIGRIYSSMSMIFNQQFVKKKKINKFPCDDKEKSPIYFDFTIFYTPQQYPFFIHFINFIAMPLLLIQLGTLSSS
jgi:hypothetical protein